jgi:hypothetical protein
MNSGSVSDNWTMMGAAALRLVTQRQGDFT